MVLPRAPYLVVLGVAVVLAAFMMVRGAAQGDVAEPAPPPEPMPAGEVEREPSSPGPAPSQQAPAADANTGSAERDAVRGEPNASEPAADRAPAGDAAPTEGAAIPALPARVARALRREQVVVIFLYQPGAPEDSATHRRVRSLRAATSGSAGLRDRVVVVSDRVADIGDYAAVVGGLGVSQAPATVIVSPEREGRVIEGFVDSRSLRQHVADVAR